MEEEHCKSRAKGVSGGGKRERGGEKEQGDSEKRAKRERGTGWRPKVLL